MIVYETLQNGNIVKIHASNNGEIVGFGEILIALDCADVIDIEVNENFRRRGIGREIMKQLVSECISRGVTTITLEVRRSNTVAQALYESLGFREISVREKYYDYKEDAIIMQKTCG